jgi:hypothetical protein
VQCNNNIEKLTMSHIVELQWRLTKTRNEIQENRASLQSSGNGNYNNRSTHYKFRIASITREQLDERENENK